MTEVRVDTENGKYTFVANSDLREFRILRNGEEWSGVNFQCNKAVFSLFVDYLELKNKSKELYDSLENEKISKYSIQEKYNRLYKAAYGGNAMNDNAVLLEVLANELVEAEIFNEDDEIVKACYERASMLKTALYSEKEPV